MTGLTLRSEGDALPVDLSAGQQFFNRIRRLVMRAQSDRVEAQRTIDGGPIEGNTGPTRATKRRRGQPQLSLIDGWRTSGIKWTSAGRSGGKTGRSVAFSTGPLKGKQTNQHHFTGMNSMMSTASDVSAVVWLPYDSSKIAEHLEKLGYVRWWGFDAKTNQRIRATWLQTLRDKIRQQAQRGAAKRG
jgi:hypothetical protein